MQMTIFVPGNFTPHYAENLCGSLARLGAGGGSHPILYSSRRAILLPNTAAFVVRFSPLFS